MMSDSERARADAETFIDCAADRLRDMPALTPEDLAMSWQDVIREDVAVYAAEFNIDEAKVWDALSTPFDIISDEKLALFTHCMGWSIRHYGLQDTVKATIVREDAE